MDPTAFREVAEPTFQRWVIGRQEVFLSTSDSTASPFKLKRRRNTYCDGISLDAAVEQVMATLGPSGIGIVDASAPAGQGDEDDGSGTLCQYINGENQQATSSQLEFDTANTSIAGVDAATETGEDDWSRDLSTNAHIEMFEDATLDQLQHASTDAPSTCDNVTTASRHDALEHLTEPDDDDMPRPTKRARFEGDTDVTTPQTIDPTDSSERKGRLSRQSSRTGLNLAVRPHETPEPTFAFSEQSSPLVDDHYAVPEKCIQPTREDPEDVSAAVHDGSLEVFNIRDDHLLATLKHGAYTPPFNPGRGRADLGDPGSLSGTVMPSERGIQETVLSDQRNRRGCSDGAESFEAVHASIQNTSSPTSTNPYIVGKGKTRARRATKSTLPHVTEVPCAAANTGATGIQLPENYDNLSYGRQQTFWRKQTATIDLSSPSASSSIVQFSTGIASTSGSSASVLQLPPPTGNTAAQQSPQADQQEKHPFPLLKINSEVPNVFTSPGQDLTSALYAHAYLPDDKGGLPAYINGKPTTKAMRESHSRDVYEYSLTERLTQGCQSHPAIKRMFAANNSQVAGQVGTSTSTSTASTTGGSATNTNTTTTPTNPAAGLNDLYPCAWRVNGGKKCGLYLPFDKDAIQLHYEVFHPEARAWSDDMEKCEWAACGRPTKAKNMAAHTMSNHVGPKANYYRICDERECLTRSNGCAKCDTHRG